MRTDRAEINMNPQPDTVTDQTAARQEQRMGVLVRPQPRLNQDQVRLIDGVSRDLLEDPGLLCYNARASRLFAAAGAKVEDADGCSRLRVPPSLVDKALDSAPSKIVLGAREESNRLVLDAHEPRVRFGSGSETNVWLDVEFEGQTPKFIRRKGSIGRLKKAAHLCENIENLDFFIRCVNIRDEQVSAENKDVNKFLASLGNITKHVQAGLTTLDALGDVEKLGHMIAGGADAFAKNPVLSFITCVVKSPFQIVDDTAGKLIEISRRRIPVVISSSPMGGATAPFDEFGMVAQINAELLAGVTLNQLAAPGAPVLYGAVPVRTRLDNLNDMYGAPEFNHYNADCAQMACFYGLPCYSTAGVGDAETPGIQATVEKLISHIEVPKSGAQYVHYAFGLLERTNVFCPVQAVLDDAHIGISKHMLRDSGAVSPERRSEIISLIREVMGTSHKTYVYHLPLPTRQRVYVKYPLECEAGGALAAAKRRYDEILAVPPKTLGDDLRRDILKNIPGVLTDTLETQGEKK